MEPPVRWPWQPRKDIAEQRQDAETRAEVVHRDVVRPLRRMRAANHLTDAVIADIRRQLKENGDRR